MAKIVIVGGSSEIANAIAKELMEKDPHFTQTVRISTTLITKDSINWDPSELSGVQNGVEQIAVGKGDCILIALGCLGDLNDFSSPTDKMKCVESMYKVNFLIPALALTYFNSQLELVGGGRILLLNSTAAFPVLDSNFLYGSSKSALDSLGRYIQKNNSLGRTRVSIVRSGFVGTKLNSNRKPTPFSQTTEQVAKLVVKNINKKVIWTPTIFKFVCLSLVYIKPLRNIADKAFSKSKL